jgi:hypothetical protein
MSVCDGQGTELFTFPMNNSLGVARRLHEAGVAEGLALSLQSVSICDTLRDTQA